MREEGFLRPMTSEDLSLVLGWRNHPNVRRFMYTGHEISLTEHHDWFLQASADESKKLLIFETYEPVGFLNLTSFNGITSWGFYAAPNAVRGTGRRMGESALAYVFETIGSYKICGQALSFNDKSIRLHRALGFECEEKTRKIFFDGENYHTVICFDLLRDEWRLREQGYE